jgi:hypothetical protein
LLVCISSQTAGPLSEIFSVVILGNVAVREPPKDRQKSSFLKFQEIEHREPDKNFKYLSVAEKAQIVSWNEEKSRYGVIAARLSHDKATVSKVVIRDKQQEDTPLSKE